MEAKRTIIIRNRYTDEPIASGIKSEDVQLFEGAWYYNLEAVDMFQLVVTKRTYVCPYKGTCYWLDLDTPDHKAENVGFIYFDINPGYEFIKDKIGLYAGQRQHTYQDTNTQSVINEV
ncbi:MAG: DUF427 domain-containing protein [Chloroflexi bacterium]|nr:DUF427 domain-containing protein [Chloroflexota bacterium]